MKITKHIKLHDEHAYDLFLMAKAEKEAIEAEGNRGNFPNYGQIIYHLDQYYIINVLKTWCAWLNFQKSIGNPKKYAFSHEVLQTFSNVKKIIPLYEKDDPVIFVYNQIRKLYECMNGNSSTENNLYKSLSQIVHKKIDNFTINEGAEVLSYLTNYAIRKLNQGQEEFRVEAFMWNNTLLNHLYSESNKRKKGDLKLVPGMLKNMVQLALKIPPLVFQNLETAKLEKDSPNGYSNAYVWCFQLLVHYEKELPKRYRKAYITYLTAFVTFEQGHYSKVFNLLKGYRSQKGWFINLDTKILYIKTLFELCYQEQPKDELLEKQLDSYRKLVAYYKDTLTYHVLSYEILGKRLKQLYDVLQRSTWVNKNTKTTLEELKNLEQEWQAEPNTHQNWLLNKINVLKSKL